MLDHFAPLYLATAILTGGIIATWLTLYAAAPQRLPRSGRSNHSAVSPGPCIAHPGNALVSAPAPGLFQFCRAGSTPPAEVSWRPRHIGEVLQSLEHTRPILHGRALATFPEAESAGEHLPNSLSLAHSNDGLALMD